MTSNDERLFDLFEQIESKSDFLTFLSALEKDFLTNFEEWEPGSIGAYIEAMAAYVDAHSRKYPSEFAATNWKEIASIFFAGRTYE